MQIMLRPLIYPTIALCAGIATGYFLALPDTPLLACLIVILPGLLLTTLKKASGAILPLAAAAFFILGILDINLYLYAPPGPRHIVHHAGKEKLTVEGVIAATPVETPDGQVLSVAVRHIIGANNDLPVEGKVMLTVRGYQARQYGDLIRFRSRLRKPHNFHNSGSFDYEKQLRVQGIMVQGMINEPSDMVLMRADLGNPFKMGLEGFRSRLRQVIVDNSATPEREIIQALLLGETKPIPPQIRENFNRTGTSHILAISGLNVALVASFTIFLTLVIMKSSPYLLLRFNALRVATCAALLPVIIYSLIAGLGISVIRATIMLLVCLLAILLRKDRDLFNTLALAALIILLVSPYALFDVSFQLSFVAVASLIFVSPILSKLFLSEQTEGEALTVRIPRKVFHVLLMFICVTLSATLGTLPIIASSFNGISTITLLANLIIVPLLGMVALTTGLAVIIALPLSSTLAGLLVQLTSLPAGLSVTVINYLASLPGSYVSISTPNMLEIICYYLLLIIVVIMIGNKMGENYLAGGKTVKQPLFLKLALLTLIIFFTGDALYLAGREHFRQHPEITAIDVGQGSATLIRLPAGRNVLIDGGGSAMGTFDMGKFVLAPYLWRLRISKLDVVILTHAHPDHLLGLLYILKNFPVREVWTNGQISATEDYENFLKIIKEKGVLHRIVRDKLTRMVINGVGITVLNAGGSPQSLKSQAALFRETNDSSLVIRMIFGQTGFLFPGDISDVVEKKIMAMGADIKSDVLFVPHHGSLSSSSVPFLKAVRPRIAVISCGQENAFNLPHPDILKRYTALPARIYRTDFHGAITLTTDGREIIIKTGLVQK